MLARFRFLVLSCGLLWLSSFSGCGGDDGGDARAKVALPASLTCHENDGRCTVCKWDEDGVPRCRLTIFPGTCPAEATPAQSCPSAPVASCNRGSTDYLEGKGGTADVDLYYDANLLDDAEEECAMSEGLSSTPPEWSVYR